MTQSRNKQQLQSCSQSGKERVRCQAGEKTMRSKLEWNPTLSHPHPEKNNKTNDPLYPANYSSQFSYWSKAEKYKCRKAGPGRAKFVLGIWWKGIARTTSWLVWRRGEQTAGVWGPPLLSVRGQNGLHSKVHPTGKQNLLDQVRTKDLKKEIRTQIWTTGVSYLSAKNSRCSLLSVPALLLGGSQLQDICSVLASVGTAHMSPPPPTQKASELWPQTTPKASSLTQKTWMGVRMCLCSEDIAWPKRTILLVGRDLPLLSVKTGWSLRPHGVHTSPERLSWLYNSFIIGVADRTWKLSHYITNP